MPQLVDLVVDRGVLFDIGIALRDIRLRLVIIIVTNKIFYRILRKEFLEFGAKLRGKGFVVCQHQRRAIDPRDDVRHGEGLSGARHPQQRLLTAAGINAVHQRADRGRLVARRLIIRNQLKLIQNDPSFFQKSISPFCASEVQS